MSDTGDWLDRLFLDDPPDLGVSAPQVTKVTHHIPTSAEALEGASEVSAAINRYMSATPEEREAWARDAEQERAALRANSERRPLTLDNLLDALRFTPEYAEHLVQPYCTCGDSSDGWDYCQHARDLGLVP